MRVIITGAYGLIGRSLLNLLRSKNILVTPIGRDNFRDFVEDKFHVTDFDILVHLADPMRFPEKQSDTDIMIARHIKELTAIFSKKYAKIIYISSAAIYKKTSILKPLTEAAQTDACNNYSWMKMEIENLLIAEKAICLRPTNVFDTSGKGSWFFYKLLRACGKNDAIELENKASHLDIITPQIISEAIHDLLEKNFVGPLNLGGGTSVSLDDYFKMACKLTGQKQANIFSNCNREEYRLLDNTLIESVTGKSYAVNPSKVIEEFFHRNGNC
jgi:nucleoside-diphosphate-sugar epimerase